MNINNCTDALDLVYFLSEGCDSEDCYDDECDGCDDCEEYDGEYTEDDTEVDDDVYDAAMEDLYGDGISIGDLDAEEMSCSIGQMVEDEIEDIIYNDMVDEGCSCEDCDEDEYDDDEEEDDEDEEDDEEEDDEDEEDDEEEDDEEEDDEDDDPECALENDMFYFL